MVNDAVVFLTPIPRAPGDFEQRFAPLPKPMISRLIHSMIKDSLAVAEQLVPDHIWFSVAEDDKATLGLLPGDARVIKSAHGDHANRLLTISEYMFDHGYKQVLMVMADCPSIDETYIRTALEALPNSDAIIGPSTSGGYVLVGLTKSIPRLFLEIDMGTPDVLRQTLVRAHELDLIMQVVAPRRGADSLQALETGVANGEITADHTVAFLSGVRSSTHE